MKRFSVQFGDLEIRSCNDSLLLNGEHTRAEVIRWLSKETCYVIAYWTPNRDGEFSLQFVGDRPLHPEVDAASFMSIAKMGQRMLHDLETP